jgi:hypothetical protein
MERFLLPHHYKYPGWILLILGIITGYLFMEVHYMPDFLDVPVFAIHSQYIKKTVMGMSQTNLMDEIALLSTLTGLMLIALSKKGNEDRTVMEIRTKALFLSFIGNALFITFFTIFIFGIGFTKMVFLNLFFLPSAFIIIFNMLLLRKKKQDRHKAGIHGS